MLTQIRIGPEARRVHGCCSPAPLGTGPVDRGVYDCCNPSDSYGSQAHLCCGRGINIDLDNVEEGRVCIPLARVAVNLPDSRRPLVKIDFSTILEVKDDKEVELTIALKRYCGGDCVTLETYELEFDKVEALPFSFTYCDEEFFCHRCCTYVVEIVEIKVRGGNFVDKLKTESTAINAIVQG